MKCLATTVFVARRADTTHPRHSPRMLPWDRCSPEFTFRSTVFPDAASLGEGAMRFARGHREGDLQCMRPGCLRRAPPADLGLSRNRSESRPPGGRTADIAPRRKTLAGLFVRASTPVGETHRLEAWCAERRGMGPRPSLPGLWPQDRSLECWVRTFLEWSRLNLLSLLHTFG